ncbi:MAG: hypothetical protein ACQETE_08345 [Bacteroidota bacterium]
MRLFTALFITLTSCLVLISACAGSQNTQKEDTSKTMAPTAKPPIAPGTANIRGEVLSIDKSDADQWMVSIRIQRVLEYGSSTPILTPSQEVNVQLNVAGRDEGNIPDIAVGYRVEWNISFEEQMMGGSGAGQWAFRKDLE